VIRSIVRFFIVAGSIVLFCLYGDPAHRLIAPSLVRKKLLNLNMRVVVNIT
jgi:hypothetical protein